MPDVQILADDSEEAFTDAVACARCSEGCGPVHLSVHGIVQSAIALGAMVEIIGTAK
jgi:hypothetical protein